MPNSRRLVVNADDFGFTRDVNDGIVECFRDGILRSTTLMANGNAFDHAVCAAEANPKLDIGCHLVLVAGESLSEPGRRLPSSIPELLRRLPPSEWIEQEFRSQIERLRGSGISPTHLDTHKHTHLIPRVLEALLRVAREYSIPWIRRPFDLPVGAYPAGLKRSLISMAIRPLQIPFNKRLRRYECRATDYFAGFQMTGDYESAQLVALLETLPPGVGEFMCHPGICSAELLAAPTRLKQSREAELRALTSPLVKQKAEELGIEFVSFADF